MKTPRFDSYEMKARQLPAMIAVAPVVLLITYIWDLNAVSKILTGVVELYGLAYLGQQIVRDSGKNIEDKLFADWGGKPTTLALSLNNNPVFDSITIQRYHEKLAALLKIEMPTAAEEIADKSKADTVYESCAHYLRENTRDGKKYGLLFSENISYGFRRNMLGIKKIALLISVTAAIIIAIKCYMLKVYCQNDLIPLIATSAMFLFWAFVVTGNWVKAAANNYARQLILSCDTLSPSKKK